MQAQQLLPWEVGEVWGAREGGSTELAGRAHFVGVRAESGWMITAEQPTRVRQQRNSQESEASCQLADERVGEAVVEELQELKQAVRHNRTELHGHVRRWAYILGSQQALWFSCNFHLLGSARHVQRRHVEVASGRASACCACMYSVFVGQAARLGSLSCQCIPKQDRGCLAPSI